MDGTFGVVPRRSDDGRNAERAAWLATRPQVVQELAKVFPIGCKIHSEGRVLYMIGYGEGEDGEEDGIYVSTTDPSLDFAKAKATEEIWYPSKSTSV